MARSKGTDAAEAAKAPEAPAPKAPKPPAAKKPAAPKPGPVMYLGPNTAGGALITGQVYTNGLPPAAAEIEGIGVLFIPLANVADAKNALAEAWTPLAKAYKKVQAYRPPKGA